MMLYKKFVNEGIWPLTVSAFVEFEEFVDPYYDSIKTGCFNDS